MTKNKKKTIHLTETRRHQERKKKYIITSTHTRNILTSTQSPTYLLKFHHLPTAPLVWDQVLNTQDYKEHFKRRAIYLDYYIKM